jgi:hypothetical protein
MKEIFVSLNDVMCCICLGKYKDDVKLHELLCMHYFHVKCVDKWLVIKASCFLYLHDVGDSTNFDGILTLGEISHESNVKLETPQASASPN